MKAILRTIVKNYKNPKHPIAFSSPIKIYDYYKGAVPLAKIKDALEYVKSWTLHREFRSPRVDNPYYVYFRRRQFQADLIDMQALYRQNYGVRYLLVIIDSFSRKTWVLCLKHKRGKETAQAIRLWYNAVLRNERPDTKRHFYTDRGTEFTNATVQHLAKRKKIGWIFAKNVKKAAIVERVQKTLQVVLYKYLTDKKVKRYVDILPVIVSAYNNRKHSSLNNHSPNEADKPENEVRTRSIQFNRFARTLKKTRKKRRREKRRTKFAVGDRVRVRIVPKSAVSTSRRAYLAKFKEEEFTVRKVKQRMPVIMYLLTSVRTGRDIERGFYENELVRVRGNL